MKHQKRRISRRAFLRTAGTASLGMTVLAACTGKPTATPVPPTAAPAKPTTAPPKATTTPLPPTAVPTASPPKKLTVWGFQQFMQDVNTYLPQALAAAGKKFNVEVTVELMAQNDAALAKWAAAIESRNLPDIAIPIDQSYIAVYQGLGVLADVSETYAAIEKTGGGFYDIGRQTTEFGGKCYGIPGAIAPWFTYYRADMFERVGFKPPFETVDQFQQAAIAANDPKNGFYSVGAPMSSADQDGNFIPFAWAFGGGFQTKDNVLTINTPENAAALKWYTDLYAKHKVVPRDAISWDNSGNNTAYLNKSVGVIWNTGSVLDAMRKDKRDLLEKTVVAPHPKGPGGTAGATAVCAAFVVFNTTKSPEEARKVLAEFFTAESYKKYLLAAGGQFWPTLKSYTEMPFFQDDPWNRQIAKTVLPATKPVFWPGRSSPIIGETLAQGGGLIGVAIQRVVVDGWTPERALKEWADKAAEIEKKYKK